MSLELRRRWAAAFIPPLLLILVVVLPRLCAASFTVTPARDMVRYTEAAEALRTLPLRDAVRSMDCHPLYPAALLGVHHLLVELCGVTGPSSWARAGEVVGIAGYALFVLVAYTLGVRYWGRAVSFWGCVIVALLPRQVSYSVDVLTDPLHAWLWMTSLYFLSNLGGPRIGWHYGAAGIFAGLAYWVRAEALLLPIMAALGGFLIQAIPSWRLPWRGAARGAVAFGVCWAALCVPYMATLGRLSPRNSAAALTGQLTRAEALIAPSADLTKLGDTVIPPSNQPPSLAAPVSGPAVAAATQEGGHVAEALQLTPRPYKGDEAYELRPVGRAVVAYLYEIGQETRVWMLPFVLWGLYVSQRFAGRPAVAFALVAWAGYSTMLILLQMKCGYIAGRYLMPLMPMLGMLAASGIGEFLKVAGRLANRPLEQRSKAVWLTPARGRALAAWTVLLVAITTSVPAWFRSNHRHRQTYLQAVAWVKENTQPGEAIFDPINLVSFFADRPNWRPSSPDEPIPVRFAVVDVERVYRTDLCSHGVIKRFGESGRPVAKFVQPKAHREGVVYILEWPSGTSLRRAEGGLR